MEEMERALLLLGAAGAALTLAFHLGARNVPRPAPKAGFTQDGSGARLYPVEAVPSCAEVFEEATEIAKRGGGSAIPPRCWEYVDRHTLAVSGSGQGNGAQRP